MSDHITAYPLCWPVGKPRSRAQMYGRFGTRPEGKNWGRDGITLHKATNRVLSAIGRFTKPGHSYRTKNVIISTNLKVRLDGLPRSGQRIPDDPGVAVYFELDGKQRCIPCDHYTKIEQNLAAVAAVIEALRTIERHGSEMFEAAFTGFTALPSPDTVSAPHWRTVLETDSHDIDEVKKQYRRRARETHPDYGGNKEDFNLVQVAWREARQCLKPQELGA